MPVTLNEKLIAYLTLFSGLAISVVAEYYSIIGFTAIFAAAVIPVIIMGIVLGVGKIAATLWLKQNWNIAPWTVRIYLLTAIAVLMMVTSMGIFGFLSKAHSDQSLVSGDVQSKIAVYDEKIKTAKENIDANRKALKQMDEAVDQVMARSSSETGADKAVSIRRSQQKERARLQSEIQAEQKAITALSEERAPIAAEVRKVEAEVGPIKYIAAFVYGETSEGILEKAVTWVIILLIVVFDPLAVILLLSSQISFQNFRERVDPSERELQEFANAFNEVFNDPYVADVGEKPTEEEKLEIAEGDSPKDSVDIVEEQSTVTSILAQHPYLTEPFVHFKDLQPMVYKPEVVELPKDPTPPGWMYARVETVEQPKEEVPDVERPGDYVTPPDEKLFVQNEEQKDSNLWTKTISQEEYKEISRQEVTLNEWLVKLRNREITMADVPEHLVLEIRARR
jgi:hypothetical protein